MGLVLIRGAIAGEHAGDTAAEAMVCLVVFAAIGWVAGWVADYLILDSVEQRYRSRVQWYREALLEAGWETPAKADEERTPVTKAP